MATTKPKEAQNPSRTKPLITSHDHNQNQRITKQTGDKDKSSSSTCSSTEKHIPNYLRPTISSRPEPLKQQTGKKNVLEEQKLVRRRSFDRPLSSTPRAQKALISPVPRDRSSVSCRDKMVAGLRSSSFQAKGNNAPKPSLDNKPVKAPVKTTGKSLQPVLTSSRGAKKNLTTKKEQPDSHSHSKKINVHGTCDHHQTSSPGTRHEEKDFPVLGEDEETVNLESTDDVKVLLPEASKTENEDHGDDHPVVIEVDTDHHEEEDIIIHHNISTTSETFQTDDEHIEETTQQYKLAEEKVVDITNQEEAKKEGPIKLDEGSTDPDHLTSEYSSKEVKIDKVEDINKEAEVHESDERVDDHEEGDEEQNHNEEEGMCRQEIVKSDEGSVEEDVKGGDEIGKQAVGGGQGKKESPIAYNNVIEETASKLLEKRKNKVKALVGAFETVIDYETAASK